MNPTMPAIRELARRLIVFETTRGPADDAALRACDRLRGPLVKFVGLTGYHSLMSRALAMATAEVPSLALARVRPDGSLEGVAEGGGDEDADPGAVVVARLLGLLVTFIGEALTIRLLSEAWPDESEAAAALFGEGRS